MNSRLDVGHVIRRVFDIYVDQASVLMPAAAVVFVLTGILSGLLLTGGAGLALLALLIRLVATMLFTGMIVELVADIRDGRRDSRVGDLLRAVTPMLGQLIFVAVVAGVAIVVGFILIIVPGLILLTIWAVAIPVVVRERPPGLGALGRSRELVRGNGWQVFAVILILTILVAIVTGALDLAAESAGSAVGIVVTVILGVLTAPIAALAQAVLYYDLLGLAPAAVSAPPGPDAQPPGRAHPEPPPAPDAQAGAAPEEPPRPDIGL